MNILVTGAAGFIGMYLSERLMKEGHDVVGVDNINDYYDPTLKHDRLAILNEYDGFVFHQVDLADREKLNGVFADHPVDVVVNLAA